MHSPSQTRLSATPAGEGADLHSMIGNHAAAQIDVAQVGKAKADYERIVEWIVGTSPAKKTAANGAHQRRNLGRVALQNPFKFPMTTAPAMVVEMTFNGQRTSIWTNVGEESTHHAHSAFAR